MGRGLSELQRDILRLALQNRERNCTQLVTRADRGASGRDLYYCQIFEKLFGWRNRTRRISYLHHGQHFSRREIGKGSYDSVHASVSRAVSRLMKRGLVVEWKGLCWSGIDLTVAGVRVADPLLGKTPIVKTTDVVVDAQDEVVNG